MNNLAPIVSFTFDDICKDVNYDKIFLFILSYEYNLNFNQIITLFNFSIDIFWTYINTLRPLLKIGDRKASAFKQSAKNIYFKWLGSNINLTENEEKYFNYISMFINDSFTDGINCIHLMNIKEFPIVAKGTFVEYKTGKHIQCVTLKNQDELFKYIDNINIIKIGDSYYNKISRAEYIIEKYYGDLNARDIKSKNITELISMFEKDSIIKHNLELYNKNNLLMKHRMELVHRNEK